MTIDLSAEMGIRCPYLRRSEVAERYSVAVRTIDNWSKMGLPSVKINRVRRFDIRETDAWLSGRRSLEPQPRNETAPKYGRKADTGAGFEASTSGDVPTPGCGQKRTSRRGAK
jgi:hypothetical protein